MKRLILVVLLVTAVSIAFVRAYFWEAFPQASIDLKYSKEQITQKAEAFLRGQHLDPSRFRNLTLFDDDDDARMYLEREMGLAEANRLMSGPVSVWRWRARWFQPPDKEEMLVYVSPDGRVTGFDHIIPEDAPGAKLSKEAARVLAESFLVQQTAQPQRLVEEQLQERPKRFDYVFTWEQEGFRAKDATYRRKIVVQGDRVGEYAEFLHVPEAWQRSFQALRSKNALYSTIAESLYLPLGLAAVAAIFLWLRRRTLHWSPLVLISGAVGLFMIVNQCNSLPFTLDRMPTSSPIPQSIAIGLLGALGAGVAVFFYVILAAAAGEPLYRSAFPERLSLLKAFTPRGIRTKEFFQATIVGYGFAAAHIAFVVAFYVVGQKFGVWSPQDVAYSDLLSTVLPWIYPLTISLMAASSEEFWFRLLAIPLLRKVLPVWLAVIIPAFVWGFLHANYPQQPGYIRGVEVGLIGVAAGFLMLRFGILATLVWHYTVDAFMIGMFLFQAQSLYFKASGAIVAGVVLLPLIASLVSYRRNGGFLADESLLNSSTAPSSAAHHSEEETRQPLPPAAPVWPMRYLYVAAAVALVCGIVLKVPKFGDFIKVQIGRRQAVALAETEMKRRNLDPAAWRSTAQFVTNLDTREIEYIRRIAGPETANRVQADRKATAIWFVRYFRPLQKEEWDISVDQKGRAYRVDHVLDEKAPGANLQPDDARRIGERYVKEAQGVDPSRLRLVDTQQRKRDLRTDYEFVWEDPSFQIGDAKARISLQVNGDEPSAYRRIVKLPEEWVRDFERPRWQKMILPGMLGAALLPLLILFVGRLGGRDHRYHWRVYAALTAAGLLLQAVSNLNRWPEFFAGYNTATPIGDFQMGSILSQLLGTLLFGLAVFVAVLALDVFRQAFEGDRSVRSLSLGRAAAVAITVWGAVSVAGYVASRIPGPRASAPLWNIDGLGTFFPAFASLNTAAVVAWGVVCAVGIAGFAIAVYLKRGARPAIVAAFVLAYAIASSQTIGQGITYTLLACVWLALAILLWKTCGTDLRSYALAVFWLVLGGAIIALAEQPLGELRWNAAAAIGISGFFSIVMWKMQLERGSRVDMVEEKDR